MDRENKTDRLSKELGIETQKAEEIKLEVKDLLHLAFEKKLNKKRGLQYLMAKYKDDITSLTFASSLFGYCWYGIFDIE